MLNRTHCHTEKCQKGAFHVFSARLKRMCGLLKCFEEEEKAFFLDHIVSCDETWVHHCTLENKRMSMDGRKLEKGH